MDRELEKLIDQAGRGRVFARAHALGWSGSVPPKYVWEEIAAEILQERSRRNDLPQPPERSK